MKTTGKVHAILISLALITATLAGCEDPHAKSQDLTEEARHYIDNMDYRIAAIELKNALQLMPENAEARFLLGKINLDLGKSQAAIKEFDRATNTGLNTEEIALLRAEAILQTQDFEAIINEIPINESYSPRGRANLLAMKAIAHAKLGQPSDAENTLNDAERLADNARWVLLAKIQDFILRGESTPANQYLARALEEYPSVQDFWLAKAELNELSHNDEEVEFALKKVIALDPMNSISIKGWRARAGLVKRAIAKGRIDEAETELQPLVAMNATHPEVNYFSGVIAFRRQQLDLAEEKFLKVNQIVQNHQPTLYFLGAIQYQKQNYEQAVYYLLSYVSSTPSNQEAKKLLGRTYIALGQPDEARAILQHGDQNTPDPEFIALIGLSELQEGDIRQGLQNLEKAVQASPDDHQLRFTLIRAYISDNQTQRAIEELNTLVDRPEVGNTAEQMRVLAYVHDKDFTKAIELANALMAKHPNDATVFALLARVHLAKSDNQQGREYLNRAIELRNDYFPAIMELGRLNEREQNYEQAKMNYEHALNANGNSVMAMMALARLSKKTGDDEAFGQWLSKTSETAPDEGLPQALLAEFHLAKNQIQEAEAIVNQLSLKHPKHPSTMVLQGRIFTLNGQYNQAINVLSELANAYPQLFAAHQLLGEAYMGLKNYKSAADHYETALTLDDANAVVTNNLAWVYDQLGDSRALDMAEKAYAINNEDPSIQDTLGWILVKNGDPTRGHALLEKAALRLPNIPDVKYRMAIASIKMGEKEEGERIIREIIASGAEFEHKEEALELLNDVDTN